MRVISEIGLMAAIFVLVLAGTAPSCTHDPIGVIPMDTMPIDTMMPPDTSLLCDPDTIYFRKDVLPILKSTCGIELCHDAVTKVADVELTSYNTVIASDVVIPFDPDGSKMHERMLATGTDLIMPPESRGVMSDTNIAVIEKWIAQGALNVDCPDDTSCTIAPPVSFSTDLFPIVNKHCTGCHTGTPPRGGFALTNYDEISFAVLNGTFLQCISHEDGFSAMPKDGAKLLQCDIDKFELWALDGAPDN